MRLKQVGGCHERITDCLDLLHAVSIREFLEGLGQPLHIGNNFLGGVGMAPSREVRQIDE